MGFNLETFFEDLFRILDSDEKASKKLKQLFRCISAAKVYAKECGYIK